jgi:hypothetical protein
VRVLVRRAREVQPHAGLRLEEEALLLHVLDGHPAASIPLFISSARSSDSVDSQARTFLFFLLLALVRRSAWSWMRSLSVGQEGFGETVKNAVDVFCCLATCWEYRERTSVGDFVDSFTSAQLSRSFTAASCVVKTR